MNAEAWERAPGRSVPAAGWCLLGTGWAIAWLVAWTGAVHGEAVSEQSSPVYAIEEPAGLPFGIKLGLHHASRSFHPHRLAFVAGCSNYESEIFDLKKPNADAQAIYRLFSEKELGFEARMELDPGLKQFRRSFDEFCEQITGVYHSVAYFYFAGHGFEHDGDIWLMTSNASRFTEAALRDEAVPVSELLEKMRARKPSLIIMVLDCCREPPPQSELQAIAGSSGFKREPGEVLEDGEEMGVPLREGKPQGRIDLTDVLICYAAGPGELAQEGDDSEPNSLFTRSLIDAIQEARDKRVPESLEGILKNTRRLVYLRSDRGQRPWYESTLLQDLYFPPPPLDEGRWQVSHWANYVWTMEETAFRIRSVSQPGFFEFTPEYESMLWTDFQRYFALTPPGGPELRAQRSRERFEALKREAREGAKGATWEEVVPGFVRMRVGGESGAEIGMGRTEIMVRDYLRFRPDWVNPYGFEQKPEHPVVGVTWDDAVAYCEWRSAEEGVTYRLPTDREWSWGVGLALEPEDVREEQLGSYRALELVFPWGMTWLPSGRVGNFAGDEVRRFEEKMGEARSGPRLPAVPIHGYWDDVVFTGATMQFSPNGCGLYGMEGNVREWVQDAGPEGSGEKRTVRGGSWRSGPSDLQSVLRHYRAPQVAGDDVGFRVVREL